MIDNCFNDMHMDDLGKKQRDRTFVFVLVTVIVSDIEKKDKTLLLDKVFSR